MNPLARGFGNPANDGLITYTSLFVGIRLIIIPADIITATFWAGITILAFLAEDMPLGFAFMQLNIGSTEKSAARFMTTSWTTLVL